MAEIVRTGPEGYEYGRTPGQFDIGGLLDVFTPMRRPVITPAVTRYEEIDGAVYPVEVTPAEYGEPEFGFSYMPIAQGISGLLSDPVGAVKAIPGAMAGQIEDYGTASLGALEGGYEGMITPEGEPIEASPILPIEYLLGGSAAALRQPGVTLGIFGGKTAKGFPATKSIDVSDRERLLARADEIEKAREKGMFAYPKEEWEGMFQELRDVYLLLDPVEARIKKERQGLLGELEKTMESERSPEGAFAATERKYGTGIFKLPDNQYRFEINDEPARVIFSPWKKEGVGTVDFSPSAKVTTAEQLGSAPPKEVLNPYWKEKFLYTDSMPLSEVFDHPELYENYPELKNIKVSFSDEASNTLGSFNPKDNRINVNVNSFYSSRSDKPVTFEEFNDKIADVLVHEIQHKIQEIEGFAKGSSTAMSGIVLADAKRSAAADYSKTKLAADAYNAAWAELSNVSQANAIKHYEFMSQKENIQPRSLFNQSDWYKYGHRVRSELGQELGFDYNKRKSPNRDIWLRSAFQKLAKYAREESPAADRLAASMTSADLAKKQKELGKTLDKNRTARLDHINAARALERLNSPEFGETGEGGFNVYQNVLGEAEARAVQARRGSSKGEQYPKRPFPFQQFEEGGMLAPPRMGLKNTFLLD